MLTMLPKLALVVMAMYFIVLAKVLRPSSMPLSRTLEVALQQHHVGRLAGDVDGAVDGDADIGFVQGGRVIDAVAEVADECRAAARRDDALLLVGIDLDKQVGLQHAAEQRVAGEARQFLAGHQGAAPSRSFRQDARHIAVVAGDHLDRDAAAGERRKRLGDTCFGGSRKSRKPAKARSISSFRPNVFRLSNRRIATPRTR